MGGGRQLGLAAEIPEIRRPVGDLHAPRIEVAGAEAAGDAVRQESQLLPYLPAGGEVPGEGLAVAHALYRLLLKAGAHRFPVLAPCVGEELQAVLPQEALQHLRLAGGQLSHSLHAVLAELPLGGPSGEEQAPHRQRPDDLPPVLPGDDGGGVRLSVVTAQLGKDLVEADAHGEGQSQLLPDGPADVIRDGLGIPAEEVSAASEVQPALVDAEGLHKVGVAGIDAVDGPGVEAVLVMVGRQEVEVRTFAPGLPDGLCRLNAAGLGRLVLRENDAVPGVGVAADGHRHRPELRTAQKLHRGEEAVEVAVQNDPVHVLRLLFREISPSILPHPAPDCQGKEAPDGLRTVRRSLISAGRRNPLGGVFRRRGGCRPPVHTPGRGTGHSPEAPPPPG